MSSHTATLLVESVIALDKSQLEAIRALANDKRIGRVENKITPDLIGGLRVSLMGKVIDLSLKSRIIDLRAKLA